MQITNHEKVGRALGVLLEALVPVIDAKLRPDQKALWQMGPRRNEVWNSRDLDVKDCLEILNKFCPDVFRLGRDVRSFANELCVVRNRHAHPTAGTGFSDEDTWRALDTAGRLLAAMGLVGAEKIRMLRQEPANGELVEPWVSATTRAMQTPSKLYPLESRYVPDLLGGLTIEGSSRGLQSVRYGRFDSADRPGLMVSEAERQLREYLNGKRSSFEIPWDVQGTPFQIKVWNALASIPYGEHRSYRDVASAVGVPKGAQPVGQANKRNPLVVIIPCHRVISADGKLGGYEPGTDKKQYLLDLERRFAGRFKPK